jgi:hypothetical protein
MIDHGIHVHGQTLRKHHIINKKEVTFKTKNTKILVITFVMVLNL